MHFVAHSSSDTLVYDAGLRLNNAGSHFVVMQLGADVDSHSGKAMRTNSQSIPTHGVEDKPSGSEASKSSGHVDIPHRPKER